MGIGVFSGNYFGCWNGGGGGGDEHMNAVGVRVAAKALNLVLVRAAGESRIFVANHLHPVHQLVPT